jgi:hypothetical protein
MSARPVILAVDAKRGVLWTEDLSVRMTVAPERLRARFRPGIDFWFFHGVMDTETGILDLGEPLIDPTKGGWPILQAPPQATFDEPVPPSLRPSG